MAEPLGRLPLLLREKINLVVPGEFSGRACFSALRGFWRQISSADQTQTHENQILLARVFDQQACSPELHGLIDTLKPIRQRILANTLLRGWTKWFVWLLIGAHCVWRRSAPNLRARALCRRAGSRWRGGHFGLDLAESAFPLRNRAAPRFRCRTSGPAFHGDLPWRR